MKNRNFSYGGRKVTSSVDDIESLSGTFEHTAPASVMGDAEFHAKYKPGEYLTFYLDGRVTVGEE